MRISIIIPAYNEENRIGKKLHTYTKYFNRMASEHNLEYEILVVINASTDRTEEVVMNYQKRNKRIYYLNFREGGKGFALIEGFKYALEKDNDFIGFVDADMSTSAEEFAKLYWNINDHDCVIASRYMKDAEIIPSLSLKRKIVSKVFNAFVRFLFLFSYRDTQCGAKLFTRESIAHVLPQLGITQWAIDVDLLYKLKKNKYKIKEIPTKWINVEGSTLRLGRASIQMFFAVIQLRLMESPFRVLLTLLKPLISAIYRFIK